MIGPTFVEETSKNLCNELLQGDRALISFPIFPAAQVLDLRLRVESANENMI